MDGAAAGAGGLRAHPARAPHELRLRPDRARRGRGRAPWSLACEVSETLTASWLLKEFTPIMPPCAGVLPSAGIWLWLRGTLYSASAMSAARFRMISCSRTGVTGGRRPGPGPLPPHSPTPAAGRGPWGQTTRKRERAPLGKPVQGAPVCAPAPRAPGAEDGAGPERNGLAGRGPGPGGAGTAVGARHGVDFEAALSGDNVRFPTRDHGA